MITEIEDFESFEDCVIENNILKNRKKLPDVNYNLGQLILDALNSKPYHIAQVEAKTGKESTFAEIKNRSIRCALWMRKQGLRCDDIVVNCGSNHLDTVIPNIATHYNGAVLNPWYSKMDLESAKYLVNLIRPKIIFCDESDVNTLAEAITFQQVDVKIVVFGQHKDFYCFDNIINEQQSNKEIQTFSIQEIENSEKILGLILLTSGSTGFSKGVMFSNRCTLYKTISCHVHHSNDVMLWCISPSWGSGCSLLLQYILTQTTAIILSEFDPEEACMAIEKYKVQRCLFSLLMIVKLYKSNLLKKYKLESLKYVYMVGGKVPRSVLEELKQDLPNATLFSAMGMAEAGSLLLQTKNCSPDATGFLFPGCQLKVVNLDTGKNLGPNEHGELYYKSPTMMLGYYQNPELTRKTIDEEGWLHSGDYGYYSDKGEVFIVDRINDLIKTCNGYIAPTEIEEILLSHPSVLEVSVVPVLQKDEEHYITAIVKKVLNSNVTEKELMELLSTIGGSKTLNGGIKFLDVLPKTCSGKILKRILKDTLEGNNNDFVKR